MAAVVIRVQVDTIPARGEHELETDAIGAVGVNVVLGGQEVTVQRALSGLGVVEAVESEGTLLQVVLGGLAEGSPQGLGRVGVLVAGVTDSVVTALGVSGDHAESRGEGDDGLVATGSCVQEVVAVEGVSKRVRLGR